MTSTRRAELQQTGELQSGELRKNLLNNLGFLRRFCFVIHPPQKKSNYKAVLRRLKESSDRFLRANDLINPEKNYKAVFKRI